MYQHRKNGFGFAFIDSVDNKLKVKTSVGIIDYSAGTGTGNITPRIKY
jgi:hypothetical protein